MCSAWFMYTFASLNDSQPQRFCDELICYQIMKETTYNSKTVVVIPTLIILAFVSALFLWCERSLTRTNTNRRVRANTFLHTSHSNDPQFWTELIACTMYKVLYKLYPMSKHTIDIVNQRAPTMHVKVHIQYSIFPVQRVYSLAKLRWFYLSLLSIEFLAMS